MMKKSFIRAGVFLLACILCFGAMTSVSAAYDDADTVTLSGSGSVSVPADTAVIRFCIETHGKRESSAKTQNDEILEEVKSYGNNLGRISEESYCSFEDPVSGRVTVSRCLSLTTEDMDSVTSLSERLIESGVTSIQGVWYSVKNMKAFEQEALRLAIQNAESKAQSLGLGLRVSEISDYGCYQRCGCFGCQENDGMIITIECNVSVVYKRR